MGFFVFQQFRQETMRQLTEQSTSESGPPENSIDDRTIASCKVSAIVYTC